MAIKRIVPKFERKAKICLKCGAKLKRVRNNEAVKCEKCGTVHLIKFTEHGNVVLTDKNINIFLIIRRMKQMKETAKKRSQRINELQKKLRSGSYMTVDEKKQLLQLVLKKIEVNKTQISKEDLMTKYKAAFDALKQDLKEAAQAYMKTYVFEQIKIKKNPAGRALVNKINKRYFDQHLAEKIGTALYKDYSFDEAQYLIDQHKKWIEAEYKKYLQEGEESGGIH